MRLVNKPPLFSADAQTSGNKPIPPKARRMEDALKLAEIAYDLYKKQKNDVTISPEQTNANQTGGSKG